MAVISKNSMERTGIEELFGNSLVSQIEKEQKITSPEEVLKACHIINFPVDIEAIAKHYDISIENKLFDNNISGMLTKEDGKYKIYVEIRHPENRKRFTIAHELAHFFLHKNLDDNFEDKVFFRGVLTDSIEHQANNFASNLLMPKEVFLKEVKEGRGRIEELSEFFKVSTLAVRVRAKQLNLTGHGL